MELPVTRVDTPLCQRYNQRRKVATMDLLKELNERQQKAVTAGMGQNLVLAGPGSGKTRVLTFRIAYLIYALGVPPYNITAVTFTNKAAREMKNRLDELLGISSSGLWLGTFHSICARLLRREAQFLPFDTNFVIYDADDQISIVKRIIKELNLNDKMFRPNSIHGAISKAKNDLILPKDFAARNYRDEVVLRIYERYQAILQESNAVDFDDLLLWAVRLFEEQPDVKEQYGRRFQHVLIDEFQDTNQAQYQLALQLSSHHQNLFVVGDEDQSIYRWRGADYRNILRFEQDFPDCQKVLLEQNYRSSQNVLDAARSVIDRNVDRTPKALFSDRGAGSRIILHEAPDDKAEAAFVVQTIQTETAKGAKASDFAIMYRTNAQSRVLEDAFLKSGMPYRLVGAQRFYGRREIKDMIAYLRLIHNPDDSVSLNRVINVPRRGIGNKKINDLNNVALENKVTPGKVLLDFGEKGQDSVYSQDMSPQTFKPLAAFAKLLYTWREAIDQITLPGLLDHVLDDINYSEYILDGAEGDLDRWGNIDELRESAYEFEDRGLSEFLENLALVSDQDTIPEELDAPTLLTLHAAKGLEFNQIIITGLDDGLLPHSRSLDEPEEMAEERRLFYVGITRAKNQVYLLRAEQRSIYGSFEYSVPSRFLDDIPEHLLQTFKPRASANQSTYQGRSHRESRWESDWDAPSRVDVLRKTPKPSRAAILEPKYKATMQVMHPSWGEGWVMESRISDGEEVVDVHFESVGFKRLLADMAKLEILPKE